VESGRIYADVSLGDAKHQPRTYNIPGAWHSVTRDGEPDCPLREDVHFILVE
jgi:hypothetical protein